MLLARPGPLVPAYRAAAPTRVARLDRASPERLAERAARAVHAGAVGTGLVELATRARARGPEPAATVVNGATAPTATLLRALDPTGPVLLVAHELSTGWHHNLAPADRRLLLDRVDRYLAVGRMVEDYLVTGLGVDPAAVDRCPPAVDLAELAAPAAPTARAAGRAGDAPAPGSGSGATLVVAGGGTTDWRKAPELWLLVAAEVARTAPDLAVHFTWFGGAAPDDPAAFPLAHEVAHLGLEGRVTFTGPLDDAGAVLREADVFLSTAREDAYPLVCAEAAAAGVPVVAFRNGGAAELVDDARCGEAVAYPDLGGLAAAVVALLRDPGERRAAGERGAAFAREHLAVPAVAARTAAWITAGAGLATGRRPARAKRAGAAPAGSVDRRFTMWGRAT